MNKLFIEDFVERIENICPNVNICRQSEVFDILKETDSFEQFPMISYEYTEDSQFSVEIDESKFLNDKSHDGTWIIGMDDDTINFIINLKATNNILHIDAFEVNKDMRGQEIGGNVISMIESVAYTHFDKIVVSPFDTSATEFWEHLGYIENENGEFVKSVD